MLKESIVKAYGKKGEKIVAQNHAAVDSAVSSIIKIDVPKEWAEATDAPEGRLGTSHTPAAQAAALKGPAHFIEEVVKPILAMEGDKLPVRCVFACAVCGQASVSSLTRDGCLRAVAAILTMCCRCFCSAAAVRTAA